MPTSQTVAPVLPAHLIAVSRADLASMCTAIEDESARYEHDENGPDRYVCAFCLCSRPVTRSVPTIPEIEHEQACPVLIARTIKPTL